MWGINAKHARRSAATILLLLAMICLAILGCMKIMPVRSAAVTATVVDEETGLPLENVVVKGVWPNEVGTLAGGHEAGLIEMKKVVTDAQGKFLLRGWSKSGIGLGSPGLTTTGPDIHLYKAGYWPRRLQNPAEHYAPVIWPDAWRSEWDGKTIELKPMHWERWTLDDWRAKYKDLRILTLILPDGCSWTGHPEDIIAAIRFRIKMKSMVAPSLGFHWSFGRFLDSAKKQCGIDPFDLLRKAGLTLEEWDSCCTPQGDMPHGRLPQVNTPQGKLFLAPPMIRVHKSN